MYHIGKQVPLDYTRTIIGAPLETPKWHALLVPGSKERAVSEALKQKGVHCLYPEREKSWVIRGKRHQRKFPIVSGIVYAKFRHRPQWDVLKNRRFVIGVISHNGVPIALDGEIIRGIMGLPTREEELRAALAEVNRIREGDRAEIISGPLDGFLVNIRSVEGARVWFETLTGIKGDMDVSKLSRKVD